jgi:hypothetical protein
VVRVLENELLELSWQTLTIIKNLLVMDRGGRRRRCIQLGSGGYSVLSSGGSAPLSYLHCESPHLTMHCRSGFADTAMEGLFWRNGRSATLL